VVQLSILKRTNWVILVWLLILQAGIVVLDCPAFVHYYIYIIKEMKR
jgi:hypothetical protein